eukprot:COSAG01_NODE_34001_length_555_cov_0.824561_1_plen_102_part_01
MFCWQASKDHTGEYTTCAHVGGCGVGVLWAGQCGEADDEQQPPSTAYVLPRLDGSGRKRWTRGFILAAPPTASTEPSTNRPRVSSSLTRRPNRLLPIDADGL